MPTDRSLVCTLYIVCLYCLHVYHRLTVNTGTRTYAGNQSAAVSLLQEAHYFHQALKPLVTRPGTNPVLVVCSGVSLCAWHSTCLTACGRHQRSSLVAVSALLTPRRCRFADLSGYSWLQCRRRTVCHQRLGPAPHF